MPRTAKIEQPAGKSKPLPDLTAGKVGDNGPGRDDVLFAMGQIMQIDAKLELVKQERKDIRSALKNKGIRLEVLDDLIAIRAQDDDTKLDELKTFKRYAEFMEMPIGAQMKLFDVPETGIPHKSDVARMNQAFAAGREAGLIGGKFDDQAYPGLTPLGERYSLGYTEGQAAAVERFGKLMEQRNTEAAERAAKKAAKAKKAEAPDPDAEPVDAAAGAKPH